MELRKLRQEIDKVDRELLKLINRRARIALQMGRVKAKKKKSYYAPEREKKVYERLLRRNKGPISNEAIKAIYGEIMSATRSLQESLKVSYWGPEATFTHMAALEKFGSMTKFIPGKSIADVFADVEKGRANYGVVPIENSTEGIISHTLDMFIDSDLKICSEISMEVSHYLLSKSPLSRVKVVYSNPQAFAQCRSWLEANLPEVELMEVSTTSKGAELASKRKGAAAIASKLAAEVYGLKILSERIEDETGNITRFLVIGKEFAGRSGKDKTSIMFSIQDRVGALYGMLQPFKNHNINLTKIESRPTRKKLGDYFFFVDFEGHCEDANVKKALKELGDKCFLLKILGSYPTAE